MPTVLTLALAFFAANFFVQVAAKPTEVLRFAHFGSEKSPAETWADYGPNFRRYAAPPITADFLAALAQIESSGNPYAQPPWVLRATLHPWRIFAPASSAVGLLQITNGNLEQARLLSGPRSSYSRLSPADSIAMTAAFLQHWVAREAPRKTSTPRRQQLAAVIHLCGPEKGPVFVRSGFRLDRMGDCGSQAVGSYVRRVMKYRQDFSRLDAAARNR